MNTPISDQELTKRFTYHPPKGNQVARYENIREAAKQFATTLCQQSEAGTMNREFAIALTKLEECVMWANASIARNE